MIMKNLLLFSCLFFFFSAYAQKFTVGEVYDFDIGDEFHIQNFVFNNPNPFWEIIRVKDKTFSGDSLTISYNFQVTTIKINPQTQAVETSDTVISKSYTGLSDSVDNKIVHFCRLNADTFYKLCDLDVWKNYSYVPDPDTCNIHFGVMSITYIKGAGGPFIIESGSNAEHRSNVPEYYKKANSECGTRIFLGKSKYSERQFKIFPNPATQEIKIHSDTNLSGSTYSIVDLTGKIIEKGFPLQNIINLEKIKKGTYVLILQKENDKIFTTLFIKE
jgi:hypothetical protein